MPHVDMIQVAPKSPTFYEPYAVFQSCHMSTWFKSLTRALYFIVRYCNMLYSSRVACRHDSSHSQEPYILWALHIVSILHHAVSQSCHMSTWFKSIMPHLVPSLATDESFHFLFFLPYLSQRSHVFMSAICCSIQYVLQLTSFKSLRI